MRFEMLGPDLLVAVNGRVPEVLFCEREVRLLPERRDGQIIRGFRLSVDLGHVVSRELFDWLAGPAVMLVVFRAEPIRRLHPSRCSVYNRRDVVPDEESS